VAPSGIKPAPGGTCCSKSTKNSIFAQYSHRLTESPLPTGGSSQKTQNWVNSHASFDGIFEAARQFLEIFQKRENNMLLIMQSIIFKHYNTIIITDNSYT